MATVRITVNEKGYDVACEDGEEDHLRDLADDVNAKVQYLVDAFGQIGDARLLLLAGLMFADEARADNSGEIKASADTATRLQGLAERLEDIAESIDNP